MRIAAVQHDIVWEDPDANATRLAPMIEAAAAGGARLVLLSEMFSTGFSMAADRVAEDEGGPASSFLAEQARKHDVWVGGSVAERRPGDDRPANVFVLADALVRLSRLGKLTA